MLKMSENILTSSHVINTSSNQNTADGLLSVFNYNYFFNLDDEIKKRNVTESKTIYI